MTNAHEAYRAALAASQRAQRRLNACLGQAHAKPRLNLEAAYLASLAAEASQARALKRLVNY